MRRHPWLGSIKEIILNEYVEIRKIDSLFCCPSLSKYKKIEER